MKTYWSTFKLNFLRSFLKHLPCESKKIHFLIYRLLDKNEKPVDPSSVHYPKSYDT